MAVGKIPGSNSSNLTSNPHNFLGTIMSPFDSPRPAQNPHLDSDLYSLPGVYTFITIRAFEKTRPFLTSALADLVVKTLLDNQDQLDCQVSAYCLMPDHLHYLISPMSEGSSVLRFTHQFKGKTTNLSWGLGWIGKLWQPGYYDHLLGSDEDWKSVAEYVLMNPVRKGWVLDWTDWKWSGLTED